MADNVTTQTAALATIPTATKIHTDDLGASGHVQFVKLMDGTDNGTDNIGGDAANGLDVDVTRVSGTVTIAGAVTNAGTFAVQAAQSGTWTVQPGNTANTTAWKVDGSAVTQPVSDAGGSLTVDNGGTFAVQASQSGTWNVGTVSTITNVVHVDDNSGSLTVDNAGTFAVQNTPVAPTTVLNGVKTVTTAGTRVTLAGSTPCQSVTIKALIANTGTIYVGSSAVSAANGFPLLPGESISLDVANLTTVNIDSSVSGEGVSYVGVA